MSMLKNTRKFFRPKVCFNSTLPVIPDSFITFLCAVTLASPIIFPVSSMSDHPMPPPSTSSAAPLVTAPSPTSADYRRVYPASLEEDYFGYWNPEPFEGMEGPGPIPHVDGYSHYTELE